MDSHHNQQAETPKLKMSAPLSSAQAGAPADSKENGVTMNDDFTLSVGGSKGVHGAQTRRLGLPQSSVSRKSRSMVFRPRIVRDLDPDTKKTETKAKTKLDLMRLPYDVRHIIFEELVGVRTIEAFPMDDDEDEVGLPLPGIVAAGSTQLRRECLLVTMKSCTIDVRSGPANAKLREYLSKVDFTGVATSCQSGFDAITSLSFPCFSFFKYGKQGMTVNSDVKLMVACQNLRSARLHFNVRKLKKIANKCLFPFRVADMIRVNYQLDGILQAKKLETLRFIVDRYYYYPEGLPEVATWLKAEFKKRGQKVNVIVD